MDNNQLLGSSSSYQPQPQPPTHHHLPNIVQLSRQHTHYKKLTKRFYKVCWTFFIVYQLLAVIDMFGVLFVLLQLVKMMDGLQYKYSCQIIIFLFLCVDIVWVYLIVSVRGWLQQYNINRKQDNLLSAEAVVTVAVAEVEEQQLQQPHENNNKNNKNQSNVNIVQHPHSHSQLHPHPQPQPYSYPKFITYFINPQIISNGIKKSIKCIIYISLLITLHISLLLWLCNKVVVVVEQTINVDVQDVEQHNPNPNPNHNILYLSNFSIVQLIIGLLMMFVLMVGLVFIHKSQERCYKLTEKIRINKQFEIQIEFPSIVIDYNSKRPGMFTATNKKITTTNTNMNMNTNTILQSIKEIDDRLSGGIIVNQQRDSYCCQARPTVSDQHIQITHNQHQQHKKDSLLKKDSFINGNGNVNGNVNGNDQQYENSFSSQNQYEQQKLAINVLKSHRSMTEGNVNKLKKFQESLRKM